MLTDFDVIIVGAGVIGLACAAELARDGLAVLVTERHSRPGQETSSRNSGVIHAGIYSPRGSLKARLCVRGREMLYQRCRERGIAHRKVGKLIVACQESELPHLRELQQRAAQNGVHLPFLDAAAVREREPHISALAALWSEETGILDVHELLADLMREARAAGALFSFGTQVAGLGLSDSPSGPVWRVSTRNADRPGQAPTSSDDLSSLSSKAAGATAVTSRWVVNAAGLRSDRLAELAGINVDREHLRLKPCKGDYFTLAPHHASRISHLIYPVPERAGLGVHLTFDLGGALLAGPDAEYVAEHNYGVSPKKAETFAAAVARYLPGVTPADLRPAYAGVRPKLQGPGEGFRDFVIEEAEALGCPGLINLIGIESPGLTASLAIAERVRSVVLVRSG